MRDDADLRGLAGVQHMPEADRCSLTLEPTHKKAEMEISAESSESAAAVPIVTSY